MLCPADQLGADRLPQLKSLVLALTPITNARQVLNSPLSESSAKDLALSCKTLAAQMEARVRQHCSVKTFKDELDDLGMLSEALDLPEVVQMYQEICSLLANQITAACKQARESFAQRRFADTRHFIDLVDGFECLHAHYELASPDLRAREYVSLLHEIGLTVRQFLIEVSDPATPCDVLLDHLNQLQCIDQILKGQLETNQRNVYKQLLMW